MEATATRFVDGERLYGADVARRFARRRFVVVPRAVSVETCRRVLKAISGTRFVLNHEPDRNEVTRFYTKNGDRLLSACSEIADIELELLGWINSLTGVRYALLDNRDIGVAVNVTEPGGGFGTHTDRHEITVVLFLNSLGSGALRVQAQLPVLHRCTELLPAGLRRIAQGILRRVVQRLMSVAVRPEVGTVVAFAQAPHRVDPVTAESLRATLVLGFDRPERSFKSGQKYYGFGQEVHVLDKLDLLVG